MSDAYPAGEIFSGSGIGCIIGAVGTAAIAVGAALAIYLTIPPMVWSSEIIERDKKPDIMVAYKPGVDAILVEQDGKFIPFRNYVRQIEDPVERVAEKLEIKVAAGFVD